MEPSIVLFLIALVAFGTEGAIGFGGTVIAASVGAQVVALDELLPAFVPVNMALSAWLVATGWRAIAWRFLIVELAPAIAVGAAGGLALFHLPAKGLLALAFGAFVAALALLQLVRPAERPLGQPWRTLLLVLGGVAHGLFGTGGPMIVYVARRRLAAQIADPERAKRTFRATLAVLWLVLNVALLANFLSLELYTRATLDRGTALALAVIPGLWLGERVHRALDPTRFERVVWLLLLGAGGALAVRSALAL
ncbi:MAG: TSUP family transporter [Kofleriaceae bacterium]